MGLLLNRIQQVDTLAFIWIQNYCCKRVLQPLFRTVSATGDGWLYVLITGLLLLDNSDYNQDFFYSSLLGFSIQLPLYIILKNKFKRNRPQNHLKNFTAKINPSDEFSFPSGHTAAAFVMATQISFFFPSLIYISITWAALIGLSRVLLGVHFPGDIFAGSALGTLSGMIAIVLLT